MASSGYMSGRIKYSRPQAILFSENPGSLIDGKYIPDANEYGSVSNTSEQFLILSDHNRSPIDFIPQRIENRQRMVNGRMRSYHIADKKTLSVSWENLPSRAFNKDPLFNATSGKATATDLLEYTVDGGAGGVELLDWYQRHTGTFYVFLSYDEGYNDAKINASPYGQLKQYNEVLEMYISDFQYSVQKRGQTNHDLWNITISLEQA